MKNKIKGVFLVIIICFFIVIYGFIVVSGTLPKFIKDRSYIRVNYSLNPFDFTLNVGEYSLYVNKKVISNLKSGSTKIIENIHKRANNTTEKAAQKTKEVFNKLGIK